MVYCSISNCGNTSTNCSTATKGISFHKFPSDPYIKDKWIAAVGKRNWSPTKNCKICSIHFTTESFNPKTKIRTLLPNAVPSVSIWRLFTSIDEQPSPPKITTEKNAERHERYMSRLEIKLKTRIQNQRMKIKALQRKVTRCHEKIDSLQEVMRIKNGGCATGDQVCCLKNMKITVQVSSESLPKDPETREKWMQMMQKDKISKHTAVCARHFMRKNYTPSLQCKDRRLKPDAVPSVFPGMSEWNKFQKHYVQASHTGSHEDVNDKSDCDDIENLSSDVDNEELNEIDEELDEENPIYKSNKMMVVTPILEINKIEDVITAVVNDTTASDSLTAANQCSVKQSVTKLPYKRLLPTEVHVHNPSVQTSNNIMLPETETKKRIIEFVVPIKTEVTIENNSLVDNGFDNSCTSTYSFRDINKEGVEDPIAVKTESIDDENSSPVDNYYDNSLN